MKQLYTTQQLDSMARELFAEERAQKRLDGWFLTQEIKMRFETQYAGQHPEMRAALALTEVVKALPLSISPHAVFAGTQRDAFARTYALINPAFKVESFSGYCDPTAVYGDMEPNEQFPAARIDKVRRYNQDSRYVRDLSAVYDSVAADTCEVAYFIEQVTGHVIADFRPVLSDGVEGMAARIDTALQRDISEKQRGNLEAMKLALHAAVILAERYAAIAQDMARQASGVRREQLLHLAATLQKVPRRGAETLYEAIQSFLLLWQVMCLEQAPNPFAFSVGNADRIFEPYRARQNVSRELAAGLFKHLLVFFNVGDRSWAISQNILLGGKSADGADLTNETTYALLDAYYAMNLPQPILSVKLHRHTPDALYQSLGRFLFTPGCLTPSFFNDDTLFTVLRQSGAAQDDLPDYAVAGCQEPLIMGKDNGNTTNSWLNMAKILELTINDGKSLLSGKQIGLSYRQMGYADAADVLAHIREAFYKQAAYFLPRMAQAANGATAALSHLPVPFLSALMGGMESGIDMRDTTEQGTQYNGSGCLIHGLSVVADSFVAIDAFLQDFPGQEARLLDALRTNFAQDEALRETLLGYPKFGNNLDSVDGEAAALCEKMSAMVAAQKNNWGNPFRADWSSPSTHLLYGYWVGATPDGRKAREMLGYGVDPLYGEAHNGLGFRTLSALKLPYGVMNGGYASHLGIDPKYFASARTMEDKGMAFRDRIIAPLFFNPQNRRLAPFYLYVNVTTPDILRKVLADPQTYAPSGVYIMRIHGTFVNFLDLSPAIQEDIIKRLDLESTAL